MSLITLNKNCLAVQRRVMHVSLYLKCIEPSVPLKCFVFVLLLFCFSHSVVASECCQEWEGSSFLVSFDFSNSIHTLTVIRMTVTNQNVQSLEHTQSQDTEVHAINIERRTNQCIWSNVTADEGNKYSNGRM